ncbi:MAG: TonB family protein [Endomicrobiaceae bacterium]|nr:TonB family protein [Endomicrobiaceae bacterium]
MIEQSKSNIFPFFVLSVIVHVAVFYMFFYQAKKNVFVQIPVEVSFYSPVQQRATITETNNQQKTEQIKEKTVEQNAKKEEIVISKKEEKKKTQEKKIIKKQEKKVIKEEVFDKKTIIDGTNIKNLSNSIEVSQNRSVMFDDVNFKYNYYTNTIVKKIGKYWQWSSSYASFRAVVYFKIDRNGAVHSVKIKESSGDDDFDQNALRSVQLASPFAPLPEGYREKDLGVYFEFKFR